MQITIKWPDGPKTEWTDFQLVRFMKQLDGLHKVHIEDCKEEARRRVGPSGGQLNDGKDQSITVSKMGDKRQETAWRKIAEKLLSELPAEQRKELIEEHTSQKEPAKQQVRI